MQHILDYIVSTGEYTYLEKPFTEVDFLALSQFVYLKLKDFVPGMGRNGRGIKIRELPCHPGSFRMVQENWFAKDNWRLLQLMAESRRYGEILVNQYAECFQNKYDIQFQAVTFQWEKESICICFRGTDESVAGWKEDFHLAVFSCIPSQEMARTYLRLAAKRYAGQIYIAGHSKGGNLSLYAAMKAPGEIQKRIVSVYDFDGPDGCLDINEYLRIKEKVKKYVPRQSLVGMLLEQGISYQTILSDGVGLMQHNPYLWHIEEGRLALCMKRTIGSRLLSNLLNQKITSMNQTHRKAYIESLFDIISYPGQNSLFRLGEDRKAAAHAILAAVGEKMKKRFRHTS